MSKFKIDYEKVDEYAKTLKELLDECETAYSKQIPEATQDKGKTHNELEILAQNVKTSCYTIGQLIHNSILFLGKSSEMFERSDKESAAAIDENGAAVVVGGIAGSGSSSSTGSSSSSSAGKTRRTLPQKGEKVDLDSHSDKATDAEYARLCQLSYSISDVDNVKTAKKIILDKLQGLPDNDPLSRVTEDQISIVNHNSGFSAITISDGDKAIVIFSGTDGDFADVVADIKLGVTVSPKQSKQAEALINELSKTHSDIVVTGHSLGGYLATSVTLRNDKISRCIAFDPPGRYDIPEQVRTNYDRYCKVTTYEAKGSPISLVGNHVGHKIELDVEEKDNFLRHGIKQICNALGGTDAIKDSWK